MTRGIETGRAKPIAITGDDALATALCNLVSATGQTPIPILSDEDTVLSGKAEPVVITSLGDNTNLAQNLQALATGISGMNTSVTALNSDAIGTLKLAMANPDSSKYLLCDGTKTLKSSLGISGNSPNLIIKNAIVGTSSFPVRCITINNRMIITSNEASDNIYYSDNYGDTWTPIANPGGSINRIAQANNVGFLFSTSASATAYRSTDGINWNSITMPSSAAWTQVLYGNNTYLAFTGSGTVAATSSDGITWNARTLGLSATWAGGATRFVGGLFILMPSTGTTSYITSSDGISWNTRTYFATPNRTKFSALTYNPILTRFHVVADGYYLYVSTDAITWTLDKLITDGSFSTLAGNTRTVQSGNIAWTTSNNNTPGSAPCLYSNDYGYTWILIPIENDYNSAVTQIVWSGDIAITSNGTAIAIGTSGGGFKYVGISSSLYYVSPKISFSNGYKYYIRVV